MRDWATGGGAKIERAKKHVEDFVRCGRAFIETHPYSAVSQFNPHTRHVDFVVQRTHAIAPPLACIAADAIHNLHVSLDTLWHHVWARGGTAGHKGKRTGEYFPCLETAHELEPRFKSVKEGLEKDAVDMLLKTKNNKSRDELLGAIHSIDVRDKHEIPVLAAAIYKKIIMKAPPDVVFEGRSGLQFVGEIGSGFLFLEEGTELPLAIRLETDAGPVMHMECELTPDIAFAKGEILEGKAVVETLQEMLELVQGIGSAFLAAGLLR